MLQTYPTNPILAIYYYPHLDHWDDALILQDLDEIAAAGLRSIWLFFDQFYDHDALDRLRGLLSAAHQRGLTVVPVLGQFLHLHEHPEVKIVNADGTTSDNPRYWNMGCFRHPTLLNLATQHATSFLRDFGDHPALYRLEGKPIMSLVHEAYYRNSVPEFGGAAMQPSCYCDYCTASFAEYLRVHGWDPSTPAPRDGSDPALWQLWLNHHAQAIPDFLASVGAAAKAVMPIWSTHELNDFYPASWQQVYTGTDWWRMSAAVDFPHEDMYPLEFDHRYQCYVFDYAKDVMRSSGNFKTLNVANGQAFNSWAGYKLPANSMSEQIFSCMAHDARGLVWWGQWPDGAPDVRYELLRQTKPYNADFLALVEHTRDCHPTPAQVALLASWTTMGQALSDDQSYDTLLTYMMLIQSGYPVDVLHEDQIAAGFLSARGYKALLVMGGAALPEQVTAAIHSFVNTGGLLIADHAPRLNATYAPLYSQWRAQTDHKPRIYTLANGTPVPIQVSASPLVPPPGADILARFEDGSPAICRFAQGAGTVILAGSYLGWDYTNYPGYYDLAAMFPFHIRRDELLRQWLAASLAEAGIEPPARSSHPDVEIAVWRDAQHRPALLFAINHLQETITTQIRLFDGAVVSAVEVLNGPAPIVQDGALTIALEPLQGRVYRLTLSEA